ncbi:uncharacterized protein LOC134194733 [Corticium candelabrum]|uniref:uncharacterized protein LOC134194733 n=1 Tax=Corticium candelabrum TaxID=121492 RepID=UPI002E27717E|nr:uncharacterized protein LOC134194733 [Corticium candelabrum]
MHFLCEDCNFKKSIFCLQENVREYPRGLYAFLAQPNILFVLFLQRQLRATASGIDKISVRFLRYLRELSTHIHVVFNSTQLKELEKQTNYDEEEDEFAYKRRLTPQKMLNNGNDDIKLQLVPDFQCNLRQSFHASKSRDFIASYGHDGYAIFQTKTSTALRLECKRPADRDGNSSEFHPVESPEMVSVDLPLKSKELLCLNCTSTPPERRLIAVIRESNKDCDKVLVFVGSVNPKRLIRTFSNIVPTAFAFRNKRVSWYDKERKEVCVFEIATDYRELKTVHSISLPQISKIEEIEFQEFLNDERLLIVDCRCRGRIADVNNKEVVRTLNLPNGLLDVCSISSTQLVCAHADSSSLSCSVLQIQTSAVVTMKATKIDMPNAHLQTLRIIKLQGHCYFTAIDSLTSNLVSWRTIAANDERTKQAGMKFASPADMLRGFQAIFDDYSVRHCYETSVKPLSLSFPINESRKSFISRVESSMQARIQAYLRKTKETLHKQVDEIKLDIVAINAGDAVNLHLNVEAVSLGNWIRQLIPTVPVQIARIENHCLVPVKTDGSKLVAENVATPEQLVPNMSFGLVETLFADAARKQLPIKVVSAQGKQSTGKSYFLNHLAGAHFDTSGWRCTEGIWMCAKIFPNLLLVLFDFEGRSTEERTVQEDCLLASFGAAFSSVVIMKNEMRMELNDINFLSKALKEAAQRLSTGNSQSRALFNGTLCVVLKDVSHHDQEAAGEVEEKIKTRMSSAIRNISREDSEIVGDSGKLRKGLFHDCVVICQRPLTNKYFCRGLQAVKEEIDNNLPISIPHSEMVITMKSVLANLHLRGVVNADDTSYTVLEERLDRHMENAVAFGALELANDGNVIEHLTSYEGNCAVIEDWIDSQHLGLRDAGLHLCIWKTDQESTEASRKILSVNEQQQQTLLKAYRKKKPKRDRDDNNWVLNLQAFYLALIDRRIKRITKWINLNLPAGKELKRRKQQYLELCYSRYFEPLRTIWKICKSVCSQRKVLDTHCLRLCIRLVVTCQCDTKGCDRCHCLEKNHVCDEKCVYCLRGRECDSQNPNPCGIGAKHKGHHNCKKLKHLCSQPCRKRDISYGCNRYCQYSIVDIHSVHECNAQHKCIEECSAPDCSSPCSLDLEHAVTDSDKAHDCGKKGCLLKCRLEGCNLICQDSNHYHGLGYVAHLCRKVRHPCVGSLCSVHGGRCKDKKCFEKNPCSLLIEGRKLEHVGPHYCETNHICDEQCPCGCLEYCIIELEFKQNESTGQRVFRDHKGACTTSAHSFSNRTKEQFQETIKNLRQNLSKAVQIGAMTIRNNVVTEHLHSFEEPTNTVGDTDYQFHGLRDAGLKLCDWSQEKPGRYILAVSSSTAKFLIRQYRTSFSTSRKGNDNLWIDKCQDFLYSVITRRIARVTSWIEINFPVRERLSSQLLLMLDDLIGICRTQYFPALINQWTLCRNVCQQKTGNSKQCQRECLLLKSICCNERLKNCQDCNCLEKDHSCTEKCEACLKSSAGKSNPKLCHLGAEHDIGVPHRCNQRSHECKEKCSQLQARNCMKKCNISFETKHDRHLCGAGTNHKCTHECSACSDDCDLEFEHDGTLRDTLHRCAKLKCTEPCYVRGCGRPCVEDHLHFVKAPKSPHFCGEEHVCIGQSCSVKEGRCLKDGTGNAPCAVRIPSKQQFHDESHYCGLVHYCNQKCPCGCDEICSKKLQIQETATNEIYFKKHVGFCHTGRHIFADSPITGLEQILDEMKATIRQKLAVTVEEISNGLSEACSSAEVFMECQLEGSGEISEKHERPQESTICLCEVIEGQKTVVVTHQLLVPLIAAFKKKKNRDTESELLWKEKLETYISEILEKRIDSVMKWIEKNLPQSECLNSEVVTSSLNEFKECCGVEIFDRLRNQWKLCSQLCSQRENECERCQRTCLKLAIECAASATGKACDCLEGDHRCREDCLLCVVAFGLQSKRKSLESRCRLGARHDDQHRCFKTEHPCPEKCTKLMARGCLGDCSYKLENHPEELHLCSSGYNHKCTEFCSAEKVGCNKQCDREFEHQLMQNGDLHFCGERQCSQKCRYAGCSRRCANEDHLHDLNNRDSHLCDKQDHDCNKSCNVQGGRCPGRNDVSANPCVVSVNSTEILHEGPHYCGQIHFCNNRCPCCDAFCNKRLVPGKDKLQHITEFKDHEGLCNTDAHQTAKKLTIENSLGYTEASSEGEWCGNVCLRLGRGHLHLVPCKSDKNICTGHHTVDAGGQRLDQVLHRTFWKDFSKFEDPCKDEQQQEIFSMCPRYCSSKEESEMQTNSESFCQGKLWHHDFIEDADASAHVIDGHQFDCRHYKHVIVVTDCSRSMQKSAQEHAQLAKRRRLDMVKDAAIEFLKQLKQSSNTCIASVIIFSNSAEVTINSADLETAIKKLTTTEWIAVGTGTRYIPAINEVESILRSHQQSSMTRGDTYYEPAIFFLSDGETSEKGTDIAAKQIVEQYNATFSTCLFGRNNGQAEQKLQQMAKKGRGKFYRAPTGNDLKDNLFDFKAFLYKTRTISGY